MLALLAAAVILSQLLRESSDWVVEQPISVVRTGTLEERSAEMSGITASRLPGRFWSILDSGNPASVLAVDSTGRVEAVLALRGAENVDWEAVSTGPCGTGRCIYVADIGDNRARRTAVTLYRATEPDALTAGDSSDLPAEALHFRYPDGPRDAEALIVTPAGDAIIISKGIASTVGAYRVPAAAWASRDTVTAEPMGALAIDPRSAIGRWVTDAALAPDGVRVVIRTYRDVFFFSAAGGTLRPGNPATLCDISGHEGQGEGIAWASDSTLLLASESGRGAPGTIHHVKCPSAIP
ncbi:MAG: hypothetical protein M3Y31_08590 [Gemmatimonadota bacterium]|nr:hypothetical protein [Gemmatimonadota bacterium]